MTAGALPGACPPAATADRCPRCGGGFQCGRAGPWPCACSTVRLDASTGARLRQRYSGCLCLRCLGALAGGLQTELQTGVQIDLPTDLQINLPTDLQINLPTDLQIDLPTDLQINLPTDLQIDLQIDLPTDLPTRPAAPHPPRLGPDNRPP